MNNIGYLHDDDGGSYRRSSYGFFDLTADFSSHDKINLTSQPVHLCQSSGIIGQEKEENCTHFKAKIWPQLVAALGVYVGACAFGNVLAWSSAALPRIRQDDSFDFGNYNEQSAGSWMGSIVTLGAASIFPMGMAVDRFGRKRVMICLPLPLCLGWLLIYFAQNVPMILAGRVITGFFAGTFSLTAPIFVAETTEPKIRGMFLSGFDTSICFGMLLIRALGTCVPWREQALTCAIIPLIYYPIMFFVPESPRFLLSQGHVDEAQESLRWLRGAPSIQFIQDEFKGLNTDMEGNSNNAPEVSVITRLRQLFHPTVLKAMLISFLLFLFQATCGAPAVLLYTVDIFRSAGSSLDEFASASILGAVDFVASVAACLVVDRFGRRFLLITSEAVLALSLVGLGTFFFLKSRYPESLEVAGGLQWLPLVCLIFYIMGYSIGIGPLPFSLMPEILPQHLRGLASSILITSKWLISFLVSLFFMDLIDEDHGLGSHGGYWLFSGFCFVAMLYIFFFVPETKGKSLEEIQTTFFKPSKSIKGSDGVSKGPAVGPPPFLP